MVKHWQIGFSALLVSIVHETFATTVLQEKNEFFVISVC